MHGVWLEEGRLRLRDDLPVPDHGTGEARVRVLRAGICNTDLEIVRGYVPFTGILGHEFVGVVEAGHDALQGKRVVGEINAACGDCPTCRRGLRKHCERRTVLGIHGRNGAFAEHLVLPIDNLHVVPDSVSTDAAVFVEPLAAALELQEDADIGPGARVLVVGDGKLGQLIAETLALAEADLLVLGRHRRKLERLRERGIRAEEIVAEAAGTEVGRAEVGRAEVRGAEVAGAEASVTEAGRTNAYGRFDIAVECTGNPAGFELARRCLRPRGTLILKSTYAGSLTLDPASLVVDEIRLVGSRCGPLPKAIEMLARGHIDVESMIDGRYPLADALAAFEKAQAPGVLKVMLEVPRRKGC